MNPNSKNLLFLLSAAPMGMAGCILTIGDDVASTTNTETSSGDGDGDQTETGTASAGDGDGDGDGDGTPGDGDGTPGDGDGTPGDGDGTPGDGDGTPGDGDGAPSDPCSTYATFYASCYGQDTYDYALMGCQYGQSYLGMYGDVCLAAFEDYLACVSALSCEDFMMDPVLGCETEQMAIEAACSP